MLGKFSFLKVYKSPFKRPELKFYIGKIKYGTPVFYPRIWKKYTPKEAIERALKTKEEWLLRKSFGERYEYFKRCNYPVPKKIGFDFCPMYWKTKWSDTDYRFEHAPIWSFVFFKLQIAVLFIVPEMDHYWECFLAYELNTDKTKSYRERIDEAKKVFPCIWTSTKNGAKEKICFWDKILKNKYNDSNT